MPLRETVTFAPSRPKKGLRTYDSEIARAVEECRKKQFVVGKELPKDGEQGFVRPEHFPDGLDPLRLPHGGEGMRTEGIFEQRFPWIEFEDGMHGLFAEVDKLIGCGLPADVVHCYSCAAKTRLIYRVA